MRVALLHELDNLDTRANELRGLIDDAAEKEQRQLARLRLLAEHTDLETGLDDLIALSSPSTRWST